MNARRGERSSDTLTGTIVKTVLAMVVFAGVHSALASRQAKQAAESKLGVRQRNGLYRVFYIAQSLVTFGMLAAYLRRLPDRMLYRVAQPLAGLMWIGQLAGIGLAVYAAAQVGITRITGLKSVSAWLRGEYAVPPEPEAQGPAPDATGSLKTSGPFAWTRHPLNLAPLPIFWFNPVMTVKLLAFNVVSTLYLVLGSVHEERRLEAAYSRLYSCYQTSGVPFYLPIPIL
jgi:protein-S-isoprenylcysteine O-methyltransferase Ste14